MGIISRAKARVTRARKTVRKAGREIGIGRPKTKRVTMRKYGEKKPPKKRTWKEKVRKAGRKISIGRPKTKRVAMTKYTSRERRRQKPSKQLPKTEQKSSWFARARSKVKAGLSRTGKVAENKPAIFDLKGWQAKNRAWLAEKASGLKWLKPPDFKLPKFPGLPKFTMPPLPGFPSFPKFPGLPDFGGWMQGKMEDVSGVFEGLFERLGGVAADWKAKRERKSLIRKIVLGLVLLFLGLLLWKKAK